MNSSKIVTAVCLSATYLIICILASGTYGIASHLTMAIALFISLMWVYNYSKNIFTIANLFFAIMFGVGYFLRYIIVMVFPEMLNTFAPFPLENLESYHVRSSFAILLIVLAFALAYKIKIKGLNYSSVQPAGNSIDRFVESQWSLGIYIICLLIGYGYRFTNIRVSTLFTFGRYDNLIGIFVSIAKFFAYGYLLSFHWNTRKRKYLCLYMLYIIPTLILAFIQAWKGTLLQETLFIAIIFSDGLLKIKRRYITILAIAAILVFGAIGMIRDNLRFATAYKINISSVINYNKNYNILKYYSNRLQYYDEAYYVINVGKQDLLAYREAAGGIITRFFSGIIPRAIWANKPIVNNGSYVTYVLLHYPSNQYNNLAIGFIGDAFASYGFFGVFILSFLLAKGLNYNEHNYGNKNDVFSKSAYLVYGSSFFSYFDGDIATRTVAMVHTIIIISIIRFLLSMKVGRGVSSNESNISLQK